MKALRTLRPPGHATIVAYLALFVALGGSAYAIGRGEVKTRNLANEAVTSKKLANGAVKGKQLARDAVRTNKIRDGAVTESKLAVGLAGLRGPAGPPGPAGPAGAIEGPAGGDLTGDYPDPSIAANAVTTAKIANNAVTGAKIANGSITFQDLATGVGVVGANLGPILTESSSVSVPGSGGSAEVTATCSSGIAIAGGAVWSGSSKSGIQISESHRTGNAWTIAGANTGVGSRTLTALVNCLAG